jgi:hypothetical protein
MKYALCACFNAFMSCSKDKEVDYVKNDQEITDYVTKNNLTAQKTSSGLYVVINEQEPVRNLQQVIM